MERMNVASTRESPNPAASSTNTSAIGMTRECSVVVLMIIKQSLKRTMTSLREILCGLPIAFQDNDFDYTALGVGGCGPAHIPRRSSRHVCHPARVRLSGLLGALNSAFLVVRG